MIRPICRTLGIREYIITVVHCMHIVLLSPLLGATGGNFIIGSPFEVYWGRNGITGALYGATGAPFLLLECLLRSTVAPIVLPKAFRQLLECQLYYWINFWGLQTPIFLLRHLFRHTGVQIVLLNRLSGATGPNFITGQPFWGLLGWKLYYLSGFLATTDTNLITGAPFEAY